MKISVNICLYNSTKYIQETLDSVFAQTYQDYEIIAIDDGSTDGTYEFINEKYRDPRLKLYQQENHGLAYTRNKCIEYSKGEYIAFLDHDDVWIAKKLELQSEAIKNSKIPVYFIYGDYIAVDPAGRYIESGGRIKNARIRLGDNMFRNFMKYGNMIGLSSAMVKKDIMDKGFRFNNEYKIAEEYDVWLKIAYEYQANFIYIPEILYKYRIHDKCASIVFKGKEYTESIDIYGKMSGRIINDKELHGLCMVRISDQLSRYSQWLVSCNRKKESLIQIRKAISINPLNAYIYLSLIKLIIKIILPFRILKYLIAR